jgi:methionyl-tRNA formyltransferase
VQTSLPGSVVFFGTPEFAVPTLEALVRGGLTVALVVTQPDRPAGRGRREQSPPVVLKARELGLELAQPRRIRAAGFLERVAAAEPALAVVVAFGQMRRCCHAGVAPRRSRRRSPPATALPG